MVGKQGMEFLSILDSVIECLINVHGALEVNPSHQGEKISAKLLGKKFGS